MRAVILAGGRNTRSLYPGYQPGCKAQVELAGRRLIDYVLDALGHLEEVAVVADGQDFMDSLKAALTAFPRDEQVLIVTADLPLLRAPMVDQFLALCKERPGGDLYLALVPEERFTGPFRKTRKNFNRFADGAVCHGNLALVRPSILWNRAAMDRVNAIYARRQSPIGSALALGLGLGLTYVLGVHFFRLVRLEQLARKLSHRFHLEMIPVLLPFPEVALDIDEESDYAIAREVLAA